VGVRIEQFDGGEVLYVALDPDGVWARSEFPDELVTVDFNARGRVIGIELIGSLAQAGGDAVLKALLDAKELENREELRRLLRPAVA
jgi:hypothetical protein